MTAIPVIIGQAAMFIPHDGFAKRGPEEIDIAASRRPMIAEIQAAVADYYGLPIIEMVSARRAACFARPRQVAMFLARELTTRSLPTIGHYFGGRDHSTVIHACRMVEIRRTEDPEIEAALGCLREKLSGLTCPVMHDEQAR